MVQTDIRWMSRGKSRVAHQKQMPKILMRDYCEESRTQPAYHVSIGCGLIEQVQDAPGDLFHWPWGRSGPKARPPPHWRRRPSAPMLSGVVEGFCSPVTRTEPHHPFTRRYDEGIAPPSPPIPSWKSKFPHPISCAPFYRSVRGACSKPLATAIVSSLEAVSTHLTSPYGRCPPASPAA